VLAYMHRVIRFPLPLKAWVYPEHRQIFLLLNSDLFVTNRFNLNDDPKITKPSKSDHLLGFLFKAIQIFVTTAGVPSLRLVFLCAQCLC